MACSQHAVEAIIPLGAFPISQGASPSGWASSPSGWRRAPSGRGLSDLEGGDPSRNGEDPHLERSEPHLEGGASHREGEGPFREGSSPGGMATIPFGKGESPHLERNGRETHRPLCSAVMAGLYASRHRSTRTQRNGGLADDVQTPGAVDRVASRLRALELFPFHLQAGHLWFSQHCRLFARRAGF